MKVCKDCLARCCGNEQFASIQNKIIFYRKLLAHLPVSAIHKYRQDSCSVGAIVSIVKWTNNHYIALATAKQHLSTTQMLNVAINQPACAQMQAGRV